MSCLQFHDFIAGTTIGLPRAQVRVSANGGDPDIVRPNGPAAALVADHVARMSALRFKRRPAKRAA